MYKALPELKVPQDLNTTIWRYMSFEKFASLLLKRALYFNPSSKFEDPFEATLPRKNIEWVKKNYKWVNEESLFWKELSSGRDEMLINCWFSAPHESAAMWKLYSKDTAGIAVRSTVGKLCDSLIGPALFYVGMVEYVDFDKHFIDPKKYIQTYITKRNSFEHEREIRVLVNGNRFAKNADLE